MHQIHLDIACEHYKRARNVPAGGERVVAAGGGRLNPPDATATFATAAAAAAV